MEQKKPLILIKVGSIKEAELEKLREHANVILVNDTSSIIRMD